MTKSNLLFNQIILNSFAKDVSEPLKILMDQHSLLLVEFEKLLFHSKVGESDKTIHNIDQTE
jgi:hypothetical protein